jgi:Glycosyl transferase family 2
VKLVMTVLVRDEADIMEEHLEYHLGAGVDFVIATDHRSQDGTTEILESYQRAGVLRLIREDSEFARQSEWQTRMARLASTDHEADWVINSDADEFWWPRGSSLKGVLENVSASDGIVRGLVRNFAPRRIGSGSFTERMTARLAISAPINDPATPFRPVAKVAHRGHPEVVVRDGSHRVFGVPWRILDTWFPLEVLHFPLRSEEQCARKYRKTWTGWSENLRGDLARAMQESPETGRNPIWDRVALDDSDIERGLVDGSLVSDVRIRDAARLRQRAPLASGDVETSERSALPTRTELDAHAFDVAVFEEAELIRYQRWTDELEARVVGLGRSEKTRSGRI